MGTRGPAPKPGSSESLRGRNTLQRKKKAPPASPVSMPPSVKADPVAAAYWKANAPGLIKAKRLRPDLAEAFALLCVLTSEMKSIGEELLEEGRVLQSDKGVALANPLVKILRDTRRDWLTLARDFGLTAASDARIPQDAPDAEESEEDKALRLLTVPKRSRPA